MPALQPLPFCCSPDRIHHHRATPLAPTNNFTHHRRLDSLRERHHGPTPQSLVRGSARRETTYHATSSIPIIYFDITAVHATALWTTPPTSLPGIWTTSPLLSPTEDRCKGEHWEEPAITGLLGPTAGGYQNQRWERRVDRTFSPEKLWSLLRAALTPATSDSRGESFV